MLKQQEFFPQSSRGYESKTRVQYDEMLGELSSQLVGGRLLAVSPSGGERALLSRPPLIRIPALPD